MARFPGRAEQAGLLMDTTWLKDALAAVAAHPWLQGLLAGLATFILEDPTTIGCGLLVADGKMAFATAFWGVSLGIAVGDLGLYAIGRAMGPRVVRWGLVSQPRVDRASAWFRRNLVSAVLISRFVPGMRLPTYVGAGIFAADPLTFLAVALGASLVWTFLLLKLVVNLGEAALPLLGRWKWPVALAAVVVLALLQWLLGRRKERTERPSNPPPRLSSRFEFWPPVLFYVPVVFYYLWLSLRFRSLTLPTISNPTIFSGGLIGESKSEILSSVAPRHQAFVAPFVRVPRPLDGTPLEPVAREAAQLLRKQGIEFPVVAKPDVGQRGAGVQPVADIPGLIDYLRGFPGGGEVILQQLAPGPGEAGVLYYRRPGVDRGAIFSVTLKHFPSVTGDGRKTLRELILEDPRASIISDVYFARHRRRLDEVIAADQAFPLVFAGNHCQGAIFKNGTDLVTPELLEAIHQIAAGMPEFYFGRFDVKFESLELFLAGKSFKIVEINGAGAEATHIWDSGTRLREAYGTLFEQYEILFKIGAENRRRGYRPLGPWRLARSLLAYRKMAASYPAAR